MKKKDLKKTERKNARQKKAKNSKYLIRIQWKRKTENKKKG